MDTARVTETKSLIGEQQLEIVLGFLGQDVLTAITAIRIDYLRAATPAGLGEIFAASEGENFYLIIGWHGASFSWSWIFYAIWFGLTLRFAWFF